MSTPTQAPSTLPRPRQVTVAAWAIMLGSGLMVVLAYDQVANLHTVARREAVEEMLANGSMGLSVDDVRSVLHLAALVVGACAAAAAVLGWHVLRRSRSSRLGLTVLAAPLFLAGLASGGFMPAIVVAGIVMLWVPPASHWFDGRVPPPRPSPAQAAPTAHTAPHAPAGPAVAAVRPISAGPAGGPPAYAPPAGFEPAHPTVVPPGLTQPAPSPPQPWPTAPVVDRAGRPGSLSTAVNVSLVISVLVPMWQLLTDMVGDAAGSVTALWSVLVVLWSVGVAASAVLARTGRRVWWIVLVVMTSVNLVAGTLLAIASLHVGDPSAAMVFATVSIGAAAVLVLLQHRSVTSWVRLHASIGQRGPGAGV